MLLLVETCQSLTGNADCYCFFIACESESSIGLAAMKCEGRLQNGALGFENSGIPLLFSLENQKNVLTVAEI